MKKILITGATGYVGFKVTQKLCESEDVYILVRKNSKNLFRLKNIKDKITIIEYDQYKDFDKIFKENRYDSIIHLAALLPNEKNTSVLETNVIFSTYLIEAYCSSVEFPTFINTGTFSQYNTSGSYEPHTFYDSSKKAFKDILEYYFQEKNLSIITLNPYDVYGIDDWRNKAFNKIKEGLIKEEPILLTEGKEFLNMIYIDDLVEAYIKSLELIFREKPKSINKEYFIQGKETLTLKEIVFLMEESLGKKGNIKWGSFPYKKGRSLEKPFLKGESLPSWEARTKFKESLKEIK